jgi:hypothetical protein
MHCLLFVKAPAKLLFFIKGFKFWATYRSYNR